MMIGQLSSVRMAGQVSATSKPAQHPGLVSSEPVAADKKPQILRETVSDTECSTFLEEVFSMLVPLLEESLGQWVRDYIGAKVCDVQEDTHWWTMWTPFW